MIRILSYALAAGLMAQGAQALTLAECDRTTHISHGGEAAHVDLGQGRVMWQRWWSQEGTATDLFVVECGSGAALSARVAEDGMRNRAPFERTDKALSIIAHHEDGARVFATLPRLAKALENTARDIALTTLTEEPCACAALYADRRGEKTEFELDG